MTFRAIAIEPAIAPLIFEKLDLVIMNYETIDKDYLVTGFGPPIDYAFYTKEEFNREWRFIFDQEHEGQFSLVMAR